MAGKSNKNKSRKVGQTVSNSTEKTVSSDIALNDSVSSSDHNGNPDVSVTSNPEIEVVDSANGSPINQTKQGDVHLYAVIVKTQGGDKLELHLSPGDSVMDVKQFLLDAPDTCFFTCYDLLLHTKDGSTHHLEDFNEISEVADITSGNCSLEMVPALYDDRSIRAHVHRTRELLSLSNLHSSLSTSLALQHETVQNAAAKSGDTMKADIPELDNLGFMDDISSSLSSLLSMSSKEVKCMESIVFSSFNPPPSYRRLAGDLVYLDVVTLEGNKYCITGTTKAFYVNSSTINVLDPRPTKNGFEATTLVGLMQKISSKFKKAFREILEQKASAHPFENVQSLLPPNSWLGSYPIPGHERDAARAENALTLSFGSELIGMQRDWNEELQTCREFPHGTPQESILRDRALYKVTSDFVEAATNGAIGVINKCIPPINLTDPECFHMYVHNNIFFSFAVDSDLEQLSKKQTLDSNSEIKSAVSDLPIDNLAHSVSEVSNGDGVTCSSTEHANGAIDAAPSDSTESQLAESEQATYASTNNDLKGTKAYQQADVSGLYNLSMAIIDYRGHRVVAQSILPGILQGDKSDSLLYGSVDNGKKIFWSEEFHSKVVEAAKRLHLKEHNVFDGSGNVFKLAAPVECKGIVGSDDRHYILDLMRVTPRDSNYTGPGSRFCVLRPELIAAFCHVKAAERSKSECNAEQMVPEPNESSNGSNIDELLRTEDNAKSLVDNEEGKNENINVKECCSHSRGRDTSEETLFNPNAFTDFKLAGNKEEITADEELVKEVSLYLKDVVLAKFVQDLCTLEVSPMDGQTLTEALHAHGINLRYLGKVAEGTRHFPHLWDLCSNEVVVRSAKHILKDVLRETEDHDLGNAISHFYNCFFGNIQSVPNKAGMDVNHRNQKKDHPSSGKSSKRQVRRKNGVSARNNHSSYLNATSDSLWSDIKEFAKLKYQFELPDDAQIRVKKVPVLRNLCLKVGVNIAARKYDLDAVEPFQTLDFLNLEPVVKHSIPISSEAKDLMEKGKAQLAEGLLSEAYTQFSEAFTIFQQVTGPMHREVANCCRYLAMVLYHAGDMAGAIMQQHKELIINERCLGLDHPDTAHSYGNMALFYHGLNQTELALRHMSRALLLLGLSSGPNHPDVAATFINVAMMFQDVGKMDTALRYLQEALKKNQRLLGEDHIQTAVCYHALAIAFNCMGAFKLSHQHEKKTYDILAKQLGEEDARTRDALNWLNTFKKRELQMNAQKQTQALNAASAHKAYTILKANPNLLQAFQAATVGTGVNLSQNATTLGEALRRGRGFDERAARAAAEVRKKAAAKGLLVRPNGAPVQAQAVPPLSQLLNVTNTTRSVNKPGGTKKEAKGDSSSTPADAQRVVESQGRQHDSAPVGLGNGLALLDTKKQKPKSKGKSNA